MTYGQVQDSLRAAIAATVAADPETDDSYVWVVDFSDTYVIYEIDWNQYLQDDYTMDAAGNVTLAGDPKPVKSITTYVPVPEAKEFTATIEKRGLRVGQPETRRPQVTINQTGAAPAPVKVKDEPLTYHRHAPHSYFADLMFREKYPQSAGRLQRHAQEMDVIRKEQERKAWRGIHAGEFEYRVEPNRTDGFGGYFTIPLWMNQWFAEGLRAGRVLGGLIPKFDLPNGVSSINVPILSTGTRVQHAIDTEAVVDWDITDTSGSSTVATLTGQADVAIQMLEQSPAGAAIDWVILKDMAEDYDRDLEAQLISGRGTAYQELTGVVTSDQSVTYTSGSPTGSAMWPYFGQMAAQLGDSRDLPPECWLMRTARWSWLTTQEDTASRPFGLSSPFFLGSDDGTPDPVGGLISWPVFLSDAIPANLGTAANQDEVILLRPSDLILLEGQPQTSVMREPLSGNLGVRIQMHNRVAAITNRYVSGIYVLQGSGMVVQANF